MESVAISTQALPPGTRVEEFLIERVLGSGGFGITYLAKDTALGRQVVIKENLPVQFCFRDTHSLTVAPRHSHGEDAENFKWSLENFSREAAMLASLDHPGIVKVLRSFEAFGTAYFVMPYVDGMALDTLIEDRRGKNKPFAEDELRGLLERVLGALAHLHDRGIYHRDIKPGNILITTEGVPVLIDFGSARQRLSERSMTVVESAGYTPFEQLQTRGNVGPWSDLYALGATLVRLMTGETPPKTNDRSFGDPWQPLSGRKEWKGTFTAAFLTGIDKALRLPTEDRWQDAREWQAGLEQGAAWLEGSPQSDGGEFVTSTLSGKVGDGICFQIGVGEEVVVRYVPGGRFQMGSPPSEAGREDNEDQVWVTLSSHFWMGETEVTKGQWAAVMGSNPSYFKGGDWKKLPVESVNWNDTQEFIKKLNADSPPGARWKWALPTEAQWERACRGGTTTATTFGDRLSSRQANFDGNRPYGGAAKGPYLEKTTPVKSYEPNSYGLYDMHGNVWEWCVDAYQKILPGGVDPLITVGTNRVIRGGGWSSFGRDCRSSLRVRDTPRLRNRDYGFRLVAVPSR